VSSYNLPLLKSNVIKPNGMILVTGPTGSGKTTTLYTVLNLLNSPERKICTIEDPVEYSVRRINQTQVNPKAGLTFAAGLRSLLRHDPDVIMIGEIRDTDTAEIAIHSALTGHLVLSTLHTNSAIGAIPRLIDMGVQGFLLASTLNIVIAQRLVRRVCTNCMVRVEPTQEMKEFVQKNAPTKIGSLTDVFIGQGCDECSHSGYKGRVSIYEMLEISRDIRKLIVDKASEDDILQLAIKQGMSTLITDGIDKVSAGLTTIDEIIRVTTE
jgi:type II secretory ATPase GspE/PulE/Tfp pilus assembly ATPase PilB-like protein